MNTTDIWLIAGLGNPEPKYDGTRHNAGYAYAAIARPKLRSVLNNVKGEKIKGVKTIVEEVR